jgi:hypothetical protein
MFTGAGRNVGEAADLLAELMEPNSSREAIAKDLREKGLLTIPAAAAVAALMWEILHPLLD